MLLLLLLLLLFDSTEFVRDRVFEGEGGGGGSGEDIDGGTFSPFRDRVSNG